MNIKSRIDESKVKQAEAKIRTEKIRRDAAYDALVRAQKRGAGPNERQRLADIYDRAEDRLQQAEDAAREAKRKAMGLTPNVSTSARAFAPHVVAWLTGHVNEYRSPQALAVGAAEFFDLPVDQELRAIASEAWKS